MITKDQAEEILNALEDGDMSKYGIWEIDIVLEIQDQTGCLIISPTTTSFFDTEVIIVGANLSHNREKALESYKAEVNDLLSFATQAQLLFLKIKYGIEKT